MSDSRQTDAGTRFLRTSCVGLRTTTVAADPSAQVIGDSTTARFLNFRLAIMARMLRLQVPGVIRHVMARGNARMPIFLDEADYRQFVYVLGDVLEELAVTCWNYCLMPNHYHLTVQPTRSNLSVAIKRINSVYALWWNRRHGRVGHVFQGRFKDQIVDKESYLLALSRYVVMNPVRAGLVERAEDWAWSSYRATAGLSPAPSFLSTQSTLRLLGDEEDAVLRARFERTIATDIDPALIDRIRSQERVLGPRAFKALFAQAGTQVDDMAASPV